MENCYSAQVPRYPLVKVDGSHSRSVESTRILQRPSLNDMASSTSDLVLCFSVQILGICILISLLNVCVVHDWLPLTSTALNRLAESPAEP